MRKVVLALVLVCATISASQAESLQIYFIDVEGGQSTLIVTPEHESLLVDTGWSGGGSGFYPGDPRNARDANRILAAARDARLTQIDYLLITHFHPDHDGGVGELSRLIPIRTFIDHGTVNPESARLAADTRDAFEDYLKVRRKGRHLEPRPGDRLPLHDLDAVVVSSAGETLSAPLPVAGSANISCRREAEPARDPYENPRSTGVLVRYGKFRFLDLGDLTGQPLFNLVCPRDLIGPVDVYLVAHHGGPDVMVPETFAAFKPRVAVMNNGVKKGGALETYTNLHHVTGLQDVWQLHWSESAGEQNFPSDQIANLDDKDGSWIKLTAYSDGHFRVLNPRIGLTRDYPAM